jgi:hypothetical protein
MSEKARFYILLSLFSLSVALLTYAHVLSNAVTIG